MSSRVDRTVKWLARQGEGADTRFFVICNAITTEGVNGGYQVQDIAVDSDLQLGLSPDRPARGGRR